MTLITWILFLFLSGGSMYDIIVDSINCYNYDWIATNSEYFLEHHMNFENYDNWRVSVIQTYEFNKQVGILGVFETISEQTYEDMKFMVRTYQQEEGMFSFWSIYV
jgi:hypothetical protein